MWGFWLTSLASIDPASWRKEQKKVLQLFWELVPRGLRPAHKRPSNGLGWLKGKHLKTPPYEQFFPLSLVREFPESNDSLLLSTKHVSCISTAKVPRLQPNYPNKLCYFSWWTSLFLIFYQVSKIPKRGTYDRKFLAFSYCKYVLLYMCFNWIR